VKILVVGQPKSGTTALYSALEQSLPGHYTRLFEPDRYAADNGDEFVLAKILIRPTMVIDDFQGFQKKILLVRDPRDNLVSALLYAIYNLGAMNDRKIRPFMKLLERKRKTPASVSLIALYAGLSALADEEMLLRNILRHQAVLGYEALRESSFVYKYEDFVAGRYRPLEEYLGFELRFSGEVDTAYRRVVRTKGSGDWQNWFTAQDVAHFRPLFNQYLVRHGYDLEWALNPKPRILPEHSTEYVMRLVREKRALERPQRARQLIRFLKGLVPARP
jgi:hypothetical protein